MRTALITGSNSGIGLELTKKLLNDDWEVIALVRSSFPQGDELLQKAVDRKTLRVYQADLSHYSNLKAQIDSVKASEVKIDVLFNNAGVLLGKLQFSPQNREMHFEVNTVAPYILVQELRPLLCKGTLKTIVNTSSNALAMVKRFDVEDLESPKSFRKLFGAYSTSKLALTLWTYALAPQLMQEGIAIRSVCPGSNKTSMTEGAGMPRWLLPFRHVFFSKPSEGAERLAQASGDLFRGESGIFIDKGRTAQFKFIDQAPLVLQKVDDIYRRSFERT